MGPPEESPGGDSLMKVRASARLAREIVARLDGTSLHLEHALDRSEVCC